MFHRDQEIRFFLCSMAFYKIISFSEGCKAYAQKVVLKAHKRRPTFCLPRGRGSKVLKKKLTEYTYYSSWYLYRIQKICRGGQGGRIQPARAVAPLFSPKCRHSIFSYKIFLIKKKKLLVYSSLSARTTYVNKNNSS